MKTSKLLVFLLISSSVSLQAQNPLPNQALDRASGAVDARIKALEERIIALEGQVRVLKSQQAAQAAPTPPATPTPPAVAPAVQVEAAPSAAPLPVYGGSSAAAKALNPDISAIGDFIGVGGGNSIRPSPALEMHESELGLQAIIDPYARGDFFLSLRETGVNLEEGYIIFTALPGRFAAHAGK